MSNPKSQSECGPDEDDQWKEGGEEVNGSADPDLELVSVMPPQPIQELLPAPQVPNLDLKRKRQTEEGGHVEQKDALALEANNNAESLMLKNGFSVEFNAKKVKKEESQPQAPAKNGPESSSEPSKPSAVWRFFQGIFGGSSGGATITGTGGDGEKSDPKNETSQQSSDSPLMFADCGGLEEQIAWVEHDKYLKSAVINTLTTGHNEVAARFGLQPPKGILFHGAPGTGKTRLALALSNEISKALGKPVHFICRKGSDVSSKFFGESSKKLREIFEDAKKNKPTLLFFDELDGLCPDRDKPFMNEANVTILTTLLGLLDDIPNGEVFIVGATNRLGAIDPALKRPGRFDKYLEFRPPNEKGRLEIISIHTRQWKVKQSLDFLHWLARETEGFTGADLVKLCSDAFDNALKGKIASEGEEVSFSEMNFDDLQVTEEDWRVTLEKIKPTSLSSIAHCMYAPLNLFAEGDPVLSLVQGDVEAVANKLQRKLRGSGGTATSGIIRGLYVWRKAKDSMVPLDHLIISPMFRTSKDATLRDIPKYSLSYDMLCSLPVCEWNQKIASVIDHAVASNVPCFIVIPELEIFTEVISKVHVTAAVDLKSHLEKLRGTKVILLATGNRSPLRLPLGSPLKTVFEMEDQSIEVADESKVTKEMRREFFLSLFDNPENHEIILDFILEVTEGQELGSVVALHESIAQLQAVCRAKNMSRAETLKAIVDLVSTYQRNRSAL